jgi:predicted permease
MRWYQRFFSRSLTEKHLDAELQFHLDQQTADYIAAGMKPEEARRRARLEFGGLDEIKEECRDLGSARFIEMLVQDLRFGLRRLAKNPGFMAVAVLSLALGMGTSTAIFALIDAVMLRTMPVKHPEQLAQLVCRYHQRPNPEHSGNGSDNEEPTFSYPLFEQFRKHDDVLANTFAFVPLGFTKETVSVVVDKNASMADGELVSGGYFSGLGVQPILGRAISDADEGPGAPQVAVISYGYWNRRFGRDATILGKAITVGGQPSTIVGVAPPEFFGVEPGRSIDVWLPLSKYGGLKPYGIKAPGLPIFSSGDWWWLDIMGRIKPGLSPAQAQAQAEVAFQQVAAATLSKKPKPEDGVHLVLVPAARGLETLRNQFSEPLHILGLGVLLVLLIACANVATLLLADANARTKEIGVRLSLGAARGRLISQLLSESLLLAIMAGAVGGAIAMWGVKILARLLTGGASLLGLVHINGLVLGFTAAMVLLTTVLFGLAPAIATTRVDLVPTLKATPGPALGAARFLTGKALVIGQIALSLVLLVGAGLLVRTLYNLEHADLGFRQQNLLVFKLDGTQLGYSGLRLQELYDRVLEEMRALPGVRGASNSRMALLTGWEIDSGFSSDVRAQPNHRSGAQWNVVGPKFFETLGIPILLGRGIEAKDASSAPKTVVVNTAFVKKFFGDADPIGHRISMDDKFNSGDSAEIVGVAANAKYDWLRNEVQATAYYPAAQMTATTGSMYFELRTAEDPTPLVPEIRRAVIKIEPNLPLADVKSETQQISEDLVSEHMFARLASFFGLAALLLTSIGLYGTMAYRVARRTHEIGIRLALGAQRRSVLVSSLGEALVLAVAGIAIGLPASIAASRVIANSIYGVTAKDPATLAASTGVVLLVALLAAWRPARRATNTDPMTALRYE